MTIEITRRGIMGIFAATTIAAAPVAANAFGILRKAGDYRRISMYSPRTGESIDTVYWIDGKYIRDSLATNALVGVPYTEDMIANAQADFAAQASPDADSSGLQERYGMAAFEGGKDVNVRNFDGQPQLTEADALIAYIQVLGTMVDFSTFVPDPTR